jgi:predicted O-methyltransferase YrrM
MYSAFQLGLKYLKYYIRSSNGKGHGTHSPFVFDFIRKILDDHAPFPEYEKIEQQRKRMLADQTVIEVEDKGAGSSSNSSTRRSISSIAKNAVKHKKYGQLLFRMVRHYRPAMILELGTSLGITTAYLATGNRNAQVTTIEGSPSIASIAEQNFKELGLPDIKIVKGDFDKELSVISSQLSVIDFVYIDGNHRQEPTERYFQTLLPYLSPNAIVIFDDIHWSAEMEAAWANIKKNDAARCTIDLFFLGIVCMNRSFYQKQHFTIQF